MRFISSMRRVRGPAIVVTSLALHALVFLLAPEPAPPPPVIEHDEAVTVEIVEPPTPSEPEPVVDKFEPVSPPVPPATVPSRTFEELKKEPASNELVPDEPESILEPEPTSVEPQQTLTEGDSRGGGTDAPTGDAVPIGSQAETAGVDPGQVRLFDGAALGSSVGAWKRDVDDEAAARAERRTLDPRSPQAEAARVTGRVATAVAKADAMARVQGGFRSSCEDGLDNDYDGQIDCADPACRKRPECAGTGVYEQTPWMEIPDADDVGLVSIIDVSQPGEVRKLAVRIQIAHTSPGDVTMLLENVESGKSVVLKNADRGDATLEPAFNLTDFNGTPAKGKWKLKIRDEYAGTRGKLKKWWLYITS